MPRVDHEHYLLSLFNVTIFSCKKKLSVHSLLNYRLLSPYEDNPNGVGKTFEIFFGCKPSSHRKFQLAVSFSQSWHLFKCVLSRAVYHR